MNVSNDRTYSRLLDLTGILIGVSFSGDLLIITNDENRLFKAIVDSATHFLLGFLSYAIATRDYSLKYALICALIAELIDVDHFIAARSLNLKDATQLRHRAFLHCSTLPLLLLPLYYTRRNNWIKIVLLAFSSHHVRDASRRGLWFAPLGSTPPIPYILHIVLLVAIPILFNYSTVPDLYHTYRTEIV